MKINYLDYIRSPEWRILRTQLLNEAEWICNDCGEKATQLHHINYENLGLEELEIDVIPLCTKCHKERHSNKTQMTDYGEYGE